MAKIQQDAGDIGTYFYAVANLWAAHPWYKSFVQLYLQGALLDWRPMKYKELLLEVAMSALCS